MIVKEKTVSLPSKSKHKVVMLDVEWTKNYRIKNGNKPFCYSLVFFGAPLKKVVKEKDISFGFKMKYAKSLSEIKNLPALLEKDLSFFLKNKYTLVGHQLCSDICVLKAVDSINQNLINLQKEWKERRLSKHSRIFDTRFDLEILKNKSRRLVDVCSELNLDVSQPELKKSMTLMQNKFYETKEKELYEKIAVLNIRHSLSSGLIYLLSNNEIKWLNKLNVNKIIFNNIKKHFSYVNSSEFNRLL